MPPEKPKKKTAAPKAPKPALPHVSRVLSVKIAIAGIGEVEMSMNQVMDLKKHLDDNFASEPQKTNVPGLMGVYPYRYW